MKNVGLIVIDEEHEGSYKQDSAPRYVARDVASWMVARSGGVLVLGSATPSIESLHACAKTRCGIRCRSPRARERQAASRCRDRGHGRGVPQRLPRDVLGQAHARPRRGALARPQGCSASEPARFREVFAMPRLRFRARVPVVFDLADVSRAGQQARLPSLRLRGRRAAGVPRVRKPVFEEVRAGTQRVEAELRALLDSMPGSRAWRARRSHGRRYHEGEGGRISACSRSSPGRMPPFCSARR